MSVDPLGSRTTTLYDAAGRVGRWIDAAGNVATPVYDAAGQRIAVIDPLNGRTTSAYDAAGRLVASVDALGRTTTAVYDAAGRTIGLVDPVGNRTTWTYDAANRLVAETDPLNANRTYSYDAAGQLTSATDRLGRRRDFAYDGAGRRITEQWFTSGSLNQTQTFAYDAMGRLASGADPDGAYTLSYDALHRVRHVDEPFGLSLTFGYDAVGNRISVEDSLGGRTTVTFDARNLQTSEEFGAIKNVRGYDDAGRLTGDTRQKLATGLWTTVANSTFTYDSASRVTNIRTVDASNNVLSNFTYTYDAGNRLASKIESGTPTTYSYDATAQLTFDGTTTFTYDANGNRTMAGYVTGLGNRTTNDGTWTYTYDAEGNVTKKSKGATSDTWSYAFDHNNQMTAASFATTDGGAATQRVTYVYDALGNRIQRDAWNGSTATTERYALDGWDPVKLATAIGNEHFETWADLDGTNALTDRHLYANEVGASFASITSAGSVSWNATDLQGSVRLVIDNSSTITSTIVYDAFGSITSGTPERFGFASTLLDGTTGLHSAGNGRRDTDPRTGKWQQEDPWGLAAGDANPRRYVGNSPTNWIDPNGMAGQPVNGRGGRKPAPPENLPIVNVTDDPAKVNIGKDPNWKPVPGGGWIYFNNGKMEQAAHQREDGLWVITDHRRPFVLEAERMTDAELLALGHTPKPAMQFRPVRPDPFREFHQTPAGQFVEGFANGVAVGVYGIAVSALTLPLLPSKFILLMNEDPETMASIDRGIRAHAELNRSFWAGDPSTVGFVFGTFTPDAVMTFASVGGGTAVRATNRVDDTWQLLSRQGAHHLPSQQVLKELDLVIDSYGRLRSRTDIPGQAHHLNQTAAFRDIIPENEGLSIKLVGNILTDADSPHAKAHLSLESFWGRYRGTEMIPTNLEYTRALQISLREAGQSEAHVNQAVRAAIRERVQYGLLGGDPVPRVPNPIRNIAR